MGICLALFTLIVIVVCPQLLVLVCVFSGLWYGLLTRPSNMTVQLGAIAVTKQHMKACLGLFNIFFVLIIAHTLIFATIGASFLLVLSHATLRSVPMNAKDKCGQDD